MTRRTTLSLGAISEGTLRPEDLIPAYLDALAGVRLSRKERTQIQAIRLNHAIDYKHVGHDTYCEPYCPADFHKQDQQGFDLEDLTEILESHCPDYAYFGTHEGDGACFGVWPNIDQLEEDARVANNGVCKIAAGDSFPPARQNGVVLEFLMVVTDHGNVTLYRRAGTRWIEVWSVV